MSMSKLHDTCLRIFLYHIRSGDIGYNIMFWPKISLFSTAVTLKIRSRSHNCNQIFSMPKCCIHAKFLYGQIIRLRDIGFNINFWPKIILFSTAVTLEIRSRSQVCNQIFSIFKCCIHANFFLVKLFVQEILGLIYIFLV